MKKDHMAIIVSVSLFALFIVKNFLNNNNFLTDFLIWTSGAALWVVGSYSIFMFGVEFFYFTNKKNLNYKFRKPVKNESFNYFFASLILMSAALIVHLYLSWSFLGIALSVMGVRFLIATLFIMMKKHAISINYH